MKNVKILSKMAAFVGLLVILPNCAKYRPMGLPHPTGHAQEVEGVEVITRKLKSDEFRVCFDTSSKNVYLKHDAIQLHFKNNRSKPLILKAKNIDLPLESSKLIAKKLHRNTVARAGGYGVGSLFLFPLIVPAIVDGVKSSKANQKINYDVKSKVINHKQSIIIEPNRSLNKVIFVSKEEVKPTFNIKLIEEGTNKEITIPCKV